MSALGLILVNFFMLQQLWEKPQVLPIAMPDLPCNTEEYGPCEVKVLTVLCGREKVYAYSGLTSPGLDSADYSPTGLRQLILRQKQKVEKPFGLQQFSPIQSSSPMAMPFLTVVIKPMPSARYRNIVDALDEMRICHIRYYGLLDIQPAEVAFVQHPARGLHLK